jgi:anti-sigma factor RsiW
MSCERTREALLLFIDGEVPPSIYAACGEHLRECPVCRAEYGSLCTISRELARMPAPNVPTDLTASISRRLRIESAAARNSQPRGLGSIIIQWLKPRVMPYSVGAMASVLLFTAIFASLRPHLRALHDAEVANRLAGDRYSRALAAFGPDITKPVSPELLAAGRAPFGVESPSLNPRGALAALTVSHGGGDDDMVVVTDVFTDGRAALADVVQAPRNKRLLTQFQDALRENAAFVPASYDQRPPTMRVVFVFQRVDVREGHF